MRLFVYEFVCGGGGSDRPLEGSLLAEGRAMQTAILADFARIAGCAVVTTCDARLNQAFSDDVTVIQVANPSEERRLFRQLAAECEASFVIAPECHGILAERCRWVHEVKGTFLGSSQTAIELCADKLRLAEHLSERGIPTIPTGLLDQLSAEQRALFPAVVKPRDGAGSQQTFLVTTQPELDRATRSLAEGTGGSTSGSADAFEAIHQPYVAGQSLSVAAFVTGKNMATGEDLQIDLCPPAEQRLSEEGRFRYLGGRISTSSQPAQNIQSLVERCVQTIPGLRGYVGFDLILPAARTEREPLIVEINPRLTTSYLGYRALTRDNLAERILFRGRTFPELSWKTEPVEWGIWNGEFGIRNGEWETNSEFGMGNSDKQGTDRPLNLQSSTLNLQSSTLNP